MKPETRNRKLSQQTINALRDAVLYAEERACSTDGDDLGAQLAAETSASATAVLANPTVGQLATAWPAREALRLELEILRETMQSSWRDETTLEAIKNITADIEYGRRG